MSTATITDPPQQPPSSTSGDLTAGCTTAVPGKYGNVPVDACNSYYNFNPSFAPAVAVAVLFGILLTAHVIEAFAFRKRYCWVVIMGAAWETIAFILHARGSRDQQNIGYATAYQLLYLLAPLWINAFVYMTFARLVHYFLPEKAVWHMKAVGLAKWFVWADVISFVVQAVGGIMASPTASPEVIKAGINVYMGGMGLQQFFILCFVGLMVVFQRRITSLEQSGQAIRERPWRPALYALHAVLLCITVRIIFRIAEFAGGIKPSNPIPFNEEYSYALDAFPMMVALLILVIIHPGRTLVGPDSSFPRLSRKEKKAIKKEKKEAKKARRDEKAERRGSRDKGHVSVELSEPGPEPESEADTYGPRRQGSRRHRRERSRRGSGSHGHHQQPQYAHFPVRAHASTDGY
ncbi:MAG: hypothetical protein M1815_005442 [Lichina confinis]|nr:MAG: hypothetical protein M1815_005442 [Lichina confinis]